MKKKFIITIDTESDNQWDTNSKLTTANSRFIPRFQKLCEKYGFKPVYLTDYTMAHDDFFIKFARDCLNRGTCEIGMHLHAWDTPPFNDYDNKHGAKPYLIEYSDEIMYEKLSNITDLLETIFQRKMVSHRAGRWATNTKYFEMLGKLGYKIDCSVTPGVDWSKNKGAILGGTDYSNHPSNHYFIQENYNVLEVPVTIRKLFFLPIDIHNGKYEFMKSIVRKFIGKNVWFRPSQNSEGDFQGLLNKVESENCNYIEFMMHSSELMPGGSPYFINEEEIENLYKNLEKLFIDISKKYEGATLEEYYKEVINEL